MAGRTFSGLGEVTLSEDSRSEGPRVEVLTPRRAVQRLEPSVFFGAPTSTSVRVRLYPLGSLDSVSRWRSRVSLEEPAQIAENKPMTVVLICQYPRVRARSTA
jgi:hypothetical protein